MKRTYYKQTYYQVFLAPRGSFSPVTFPTLEEAEGHIKNSINSQAQDSEYFEYWEEKKNTATIEKVTEIREIMQ